MKKKREKNDTLFILIIVAIISILFNTFIAQMAQVNGPSMEPTLKNKQYLLLSKVSKKYERGDIIVFRHNNNYLIKRVIALPYETVQIKENDVYINGEKIKDFVNIEMENMGILEKEMTLKENEYIVMGDNRNHSVDSREIGTIKKEKIVGKVALRIFPFRTF